MKELISILCPVNEFSRSERPWAIVGAVLMCAGLVLCCTDSLVCGAIAVCLMAGALCAFRRAEREQEGAKSASINAKEWEEAA